MWAITFVIDGIRKENDCSHLIVGIAYSLKENEVGNPIYEVLPLYL